MRAQVMMTLMMACLLLAASISGTGKDLNENVEADYVGPTSTTTAWGVSYDWSELPGDIKDLTGFDIDQILNDLEEAALDGNINLDLTYGINGFTHYYVVQGPGPSTQIELADGGETIDVDTVVTVITLRMSMESSMGADFDWEDDGVGFDVDFDTMGTTGVVVDIEMTEYYTSDFHFAGMDLKVSGGISMGSTAVLDADIFAGTDLIKFDDTTISLSLDYTVTELTAEWRMEEVSTIYEDIISGDYASITWDCDSWFSESNRESWDEGGTFEAVNSSSESDDGRMMHSGNYGSQNYEDYEYEEWTISDSSADGIKLHFADFKTETYYDKLEIYDAHSGNWLDSFDGIYWAYGESVWYDTNAINLVWSSDGSSTHDGWMIDYWQSGISTGGELHLHLEDACGEVDYSWDVGFEYDFSLKRFPAKDLGLTSDQASFSLSDAMTESGNENREGMAFYHTMYIEDHNYEIQTADGTKNVVRLESAGPMIEAIGGLMGGAMGLAIEDSDLDDPTEEFEEEAEEWADDYDDDDNEMWDIGEDFEDSDIVDDIEEIAEEVEDVMDDIGGDLETKYGDERMYWLIDKDTGHQITPQLLVFDMEDGNNEHWVQMIGPDGTEYETPSGDESVEIEHHQGDAAEEKQEEIADLEMNDLFSSSKDEGSLMMYILTGGIALAVVLMLGAFVMVMRRKGGREIDYGAEYNINQAFNQDEYDSFTASMGSTNQNAMGGSMAPPSGPPAPPSGPPATMQGQMKDGFEWAEYPPNSGTWYYRDQITQQWVRHQ
jgi:hypothetical protein